MTPGAESPRLWPSLLLGLLIAFGGGCAGDSPPPPRPNSTPVTPSLSEPPTVVTGSGSAEAEPLSLGAPTPVEHPVLLDELEGGFPQLGQLQGPAALSVEGALNLERAPCVPCWNDHASIATCALAGPPAGCENIGGLVDRALRLGLAGASVPAIQAVLTYSEPWFPTAAASGQAWPGPSVVSVELWVDPGWGPWQEAAGRAAQLIDAAQADASLVRPAVQVRLFPSWSARDQPVPDDRLALHRAVAAAELQGQGLPFLRALAAHDGDPADAAASLSTLDQAAWASAQGGAAAQARLDQDAAAAAALGLRSAPSWRIQGYRLRGHQRLSSLVDRLQNESVDHLESLPAELLAPVPSPAPAAGSSAAGSSAAGSSAAGSSAAGSSAAGSSAAEFLEPDQP